jgi:hypothetical protein
MLNRSLWLEEMIKWDVFLNREGVNGKGPIRLLTI